MKSFLVFAALALLHAQDGHRDLGGDGVWLPAHVADIGSKSEIPFQDWAKLRFQTNHAMTRNTMDSRCLPPGVPRIMLMVRSSPTCTTDMSSPACRPIRSGRAGCKDSH